MKIQINKNRGWRGLAELVITEDEKIIKRHIFSFSQEVWDDLMAGSIVIQDDNFYTVLDIDNIDALPHGHQRSVLIKNFTANVVNRTSYPKAAWRDAASKDGYLSRDYFLIEKYLANKNNHTVSDWNCIGLRVIPTI